MNNFRYITCYIPTAYTDLQKLYYLYGIVHTLEMTEDKRTEVLHKLDAAVKSCQQTDERHRPNAATLLRLIKTFTNNSHSIVERLMNKVAQHAQGLQIVVSERTKELLEETLNVDNLLREILPQYGQRQNTIQCIT